MDCQRAAALVARRHELTSVIERLELQTAVDHAYTCNCETCSQAVAMLFGQGLSISIAFA
ncbi:MAG: hypothetical protein HYY50_03870 [Candidatus Kerfeldbacteria bacterium]|nr:hypothetical protein [Candidatus Kerfeldbacteria bacterium]